MTYTIIVWVVEAFAKLHKFVEWSVFDTTSADSHAQSTIQPIILLAL